MKTGLLLIALAQALVYSGGDSMGSIRLDPPNKRPCTPVTLWMCNEPEWNLRVTYKGRTFAVPRASLTRYVAAHPEFLEAGK